MFKISSEFILFEIKRIEYEELAPDLVNRVSA